MARFRLSTDILSPLNSDISLNDGSAFSFGSLPGTPPPHFDINMASPIHTTSAKDTDISLLLAKSMKEYANAFDEITSDIQRQSSTNSEKEEKYKESYEMLKKSMDDLFSEEFDSAISPPQFTNALENKNIQSKKNSEANVVAKLKDSKNPKVLKKNTCPSTERNAEIPEKKTEKHIKEDSAISKHKKNLPQPQSKRSSSSSESVKGTKDTDHVHTGNDAIASKRKDAMTDQKKNSKIASSNKDGSSREAKRTSSKMLSEKKKEKGVEDIKKFDFKCQKKIPATNNEPIVHPKSSSIEKSIQLAVSMEMDNLRRFVLHQNLYMHKDLWKLQEMVKKQNEVTDYLFTVIDELVDTNKKLISKYK